MRKSVTTDKTMQQDSLAAPDIRRRRINDFLPSERYAVCILLLLALGLRLIIINLLKTIPVSDGLAYWNMATSMLNTGLMDDGFGFVAYYSVGYPLFLIPFLAIFGHNPFVVEVVNVFLGTGAVFLVYACARKVLSDWIWALVPALVWATYPPALFTTEIIGKENLSIPIVLSIVFLLLKYQESVRKNALSLAAGVLYGFGLLVSTSTILTGALVAAVVIGLRLKGLRLDASQLRPVALLWCVVGSLVVLAPWFSYTNYRLGYPVLCTGGGFNLYLGNNPNATGHYVGIQDTPVASRWPEIKKSQGEVASMSYLRDLALAYMRENPGKTIWLSVKKFGYFWFPPSLTQSKGESFIKMAGKWAWFIVYSTVLVFFIFSLIMFKKMNDKHLILIFYILLYSAVHVAAVILLRYRLTIVPLMCVVAVHSLQHSCLWWRGAARQTLKRHCQGNLV